MLHTLESPTHAWQSILRTAKLPALFVSAALCLSAGCAVDGSTLAGPDGDFDRMDLQAAVHPGMAHVSGIGHFAEPGVCADPEGQGSDYELLLTGDLVGCVYVFVETAVCAPGGAYRETGTETFVGQYKGAPGTFRTTYLFTAKYRDCENLAGQISGRCQHPITAGSGAGVFEGVTGRLDMTDDIAAGNFAYRGHFRS